jgi:hypothetical protein
MHHDHPHVLNYSDDLSGHNCDLCQESIEDNGYRCSRGCDFDVCMKCGGPLQECAGGIKLVNLDALKYEAIYKISEGDHVLSAKDPTKKGVVIWDYGTEYPDDPEPYYVRWNEGEDDENSWQKPEDIVRASLLHPCRPLHAAVPQFNVDPKVQEYLQNGQISQVVSGGQVCVCVCTYAHVYIMRMRPLNLHACTKAYTRCGYVCVCMCVLDM